MLTVAAALFICSSPGVFLNAERAETTRVHLFVTSPTRAFVLTRVQRPGEQYLTDMLAVETLCRNNCDLDVDVDPRLDYVLEVVSDTPGETVWRYRYQVDMTAYGDSLVLKVEPPAQARFTASKVMVPVGIVGSIVATAVTLVGSIVAASSMSAPPGYQQSLFGVDPAIFALSGAGGIVLSMVTCIVGVVLRRAAVIDVTEMPVALIRRQVRCRRCLRGLRARYRCEHALCHAAPLSRPKVGGLLP